MSQTPIFDALFEEFLEAHRWTPSANTPNEEDFINLDPPIPFVNETQEIPVAGPAPSIIQSIIQSLRELHSQPMKHVKLDIPTWMTDEAEPTAEQPTFEAPSHPFEGLMKQHQHNVLYPVTMPTRDAIGWTPREIETPAPEPEEAEHVFPLTRDYEGRRRFLQKPSVTKIREIVENAVFEHTPA